MLFLPEEFYLEHDVVALGKNFLGKYLFTQTSAGTTGGIITETESYKGPEDKASHAYNMRKTARNEVMYHKGGIAYVYICYGIHHLLNFVTNVENIPHAVLIRSIQPTYGIEIMLKRRKKKILNDIIATGPGNLTQAMGINSSFNGASLAGPLIWVEDRGMKPQKKQIIASPRVGIDYAGEDAFLPWRFRLKSL